MASGLRLLADTLSGGLSVVVGGPMWWLLLGAAFVTVRHHLRRARAQQGSRPVTESPAG